VDNIYFILKKVCCEKNNIVFYDETVFSIMLDAVFVLSCLEIMRIKLTRNDIERIFSPQEKKKQL